MCKKSVMLLMVSKYLRHNHNKSRFFGCEAVGLVILPSDWTSYKAIFRHDLVCTLAVAIIDFKSWPEIIVNSYFFCSNEMSFLIGSLPRSAPHSPKFMKPYDLI
jgi:hypothetical protein